jgi:hypothetical protein
MCSPKIAGSLTIAEVKAGTINKAISPAKSVVIFFMMNLISKLQK